VYKTTIEDRLLKDSVGFVYEIHCKVVRKLEQEKIEKFALAVGGNLEMFEANKAILSSIPTRIVFDKRLYLSEGMFFSTHSVWKSLFAFCLGPDLNDERKQALNEWIKALAFVLSTSIRNEYQLLSAQLEKLWKTTFIGRTPMQLFFLVALCRENKLTCNTLTNDRIMEEEHPWLMLLYTRYITTLPAHSCSKVTCA
jgi:hypothetical protein